MTLRAALIAIFALTAAAPAFAQDKPAIVAEAPTPESIEAGRNLFQSILFDSGAMDGLFDAVSKLILPQLRQRMRTSPVYLEASERGRAALDTYIESFPDLVEREFTAEFGGMADSVAPRFAGLMSPEHLNAAADFMRTPEMRERWADMVEDVTRTDSSSDTFPPWRDMAFAETEAGLALAARQDQIGDILEAAFEERMVLFEPRIRSVIAEGMCNALADECPEHIREAIGRI